MQPKYEYRPHFASVGIQQSTVIGAVTDYTPFYNLIKSNIFSFFIGPNREHIPSPHITHFITYPSRGEMLEIEAEISYNGQRLGVRQIVELISIETRDDYSIDRLLHVLNSMIHQLKMGMYDLSKYKVELDIIYHNLMENIQSVNMRPDLHEFSNHRLQEIEKTMNNEFERIFMAADGGAATLDGHSTGTGQSLRDFVEDTLKDTDTKQMEIDEHNLKLEAEKKALEEEEAEYQKINSYIEDGAATLRLNRITIKELSKDRTNKFVLPLEAGRVVDIDKFMHLTKQPFSFLNYNGAQFSVNLTTGSHTMWDESKDESLWNDLVTQGENGSKLIKTIIKAKKDYITERRLKLNKANNKLDEQVTYLKEQFEKKAEKFQHSAYVKFIATRTANNIKTIREAQSYSIRVEKALKNKRLTSNPIAFFERAVTLFLGETGEDIIRDLYNLGFTSREDHEFAIRYLYYMLRVVKEAEDEYTSPIVAIMDKEYFNIGFKKSPIMRVIAGHMFVHTVNIVKDYKVPETVKAEVPEMNEVMKQTVTGSTGPR